MHAGVAGCQGDLLGPRQHPQDGDANEAAVEDQFCALKWAEAIFTHTPMLAK